MQEAFTVTKLYPSIYKKNPYFYYLFCFMCYKLHNFFIRDAVINT